MRDSLEMLWRHQRITAGTNVGCVLFNRLQEQPLEVSRHSVPIGFCRCVTRASRHPREQYRRSLPNQPRR
jgi:hypothetical protein